MRKITDQTPKIVIIGLGFLMRYMKSCFKKLTGAAYPQNVVGTTETAGTIGAKQREMGISIVHRAYLETLESIRPDIIMLSPPPTSVDSLTETILQPYYRALRHKDQPLPDLYAFPPDPRVGYYANQLGEDVFSVNVLPNMTARQTGDSPECYSVISYAENETLDPDKVRRVKTFLEPLGATITIPPVDFTAFLGGYVVCHLILNFAFACQDGLAERGQLVDIREISAEMLASLSVSPEETLEWNENKVARDVQTMLKRFIRGIMIYYADSGLPPLLMEDMIRMQLKAFVTLLQSETRDSLIKASQNHATKGGLLEKATFLFNQEIQQDIRQEFASDGMLSDAFTVQIEKFGYQTSKTISTFSDGYSGITNY